MIYTKERYNRLLMALLGDESLVERWWKSPNKAFSGSTPDQISESDPQTLHRYILGQFNGDYS